jgi:hypothetical protein
LRRGCKPKRGCATRRGCTTSRPKQQWNRRGRRRRRREKKRWTVGKGREKNDTGG